MAEKVTADIGFEKQIWDAACVLRGNMDASEYKNVVLGLIFLKYIGSITKPVGFGVAVIVPPAGIE